MARASFLFILQIFLAAYFIGWALDFAKNFDIFRAQRCLIAGMHLSRGSDFRQGEFTLSKTEHDRPPGRDKQKLESGGKPPTRSPP